MDNFYKPRWIADLEKLEMYERQPDGSYRFAYQMTPAPASNSPGFIPTIPLIR